MEEESSVYSLGLHGALHTRPVQCQRGQIPDIRSRYLEIVSRHSPPTAEVPYTVSEFQ